MISTVVSAVQVYASGVVNFVTDASPILVRRFADEYCRSTFTSFLFWPLYKHVDQ